MRTVVRAAAYLIRHFNGGPNDLCLTAQGEVTYVFEANPGKPHTVFLDDVT